MREWLTECGQLHQPHGGGQPCNDPSSITCKLPRSCSKAKTVAHTLVYTHTHSLSRAHTILQGLTHGSNDIRIVACEVCGGISSPSDPLLAAVLPPLLQNSREKNTAVKASAESAVVDLVRGDEGVKVCGCEYGWICGSCPWGRGSEGVWV